MKTSWCKVKDTINIDELAEMFGIISWDKLDDMNFHYYWESSHYAESTAPPGSTPGEIEELQHKAEDEAREELFEKWHGGVLRAAETLFDIHRLKLVPNKKGGKYPYEFRIKPEAGWQLAALEIIKTINGAGYFHFGSVPEFLRSGPYTARKAVLSHLHWIKDWPAVYGERSAQQIYENYMR